MALRWLEGFETHSNNGQWDRRYSTRTGSFVTQTGRVFGNAGSLAAPVFIPPSFALADTWGVGFGIKLVAQAGTIGTTEGLYFEKGGVEQVHLTFVKSAGSFEVALYRGATQLAVSSAAYSYNAWHQFELSVTVHTSAGAYELRHNEVSVFSASSVNTANAGTNQASEFAIRFSGTSTNNQFDDIFVWDGTGSKNNTFRGDCIIEGISPSGAGATTQWTPSAGSNFDNVDDPGTAAPDDAGAGGFNSSDTNTQKDLYAFGDLVQITGSVLGVQLDTQLAMAAAGSRVVTTRFRDDSTTEADIAAHTVASTTYQSFPDVMDVNPQSGVDWDITDINGGQFGVVVTS